MAWVAAELLVSADRRTTELVSSLLELLFGADVAGMATLPLAAVGGSRVQTGVASGVGRDYRHVK